MGGVGFGGGCRRGGSLICSMPGKGTVCDRWRCCCCCCCSARLSGWPRTGTCWECWLCMAAWAAIWLAERGVVEAGGGMLIWARLDMLAEGRKGSKWPWVCECLRLCARWPGPARGEAFLAAAGESEGLTGRE